MPEATTPPPRHLIDDRATAALRLGVLISGSGTNLQAIIDASPTGALDADVAVVISDKDVGVRARAGAQRRHPGRLHRPQQLRRLTGVQPRARARAARARRRPRRDGRLHAAARPARARGVPGARHEHPPGAAAGFPGASGITRRVRVRREGHRRDRALRQRGLRRGPDHRAGAGRRRGDRRRRVARGARSTRSSTASTRAPSSCSPRTASSSRAARCACCRSRAELGRRARPSRSSRRSRAVTPRPGRVSRRRGLERLCRSSVLGGSASYPEDAGQEAAWCRLCRLGRAFRAARSRDSRYRPRPLRAILLLVRLASHASCIADASFMQHRASERIRLCAGPAWRCWPPRSAAAPRSRRARARPRRHRGRGRGRAADRAAKTVKIGFAAPLTGDNAVYGAGMKRAVELAIKEANASDEAKEAGVHVRRAAAGRHGRPEAGRQRREPARRRHRRRRASSATSTPVARSRRRRSTRRPSSRWSPSPRTRSSPRRATRT